MGRRLLGLICAPLVLACESSTGPELTIHTLQGSWQQIRCEAVAIADTTISQECTNGAEALYIAPSGAFELTLLTPPGQDPRPPITGQLIGSGRSLRAVYSDFPADTAYISYDRQDDTHSWTVFALYGFDPQGLLDAALTVTYAQHTR